MSDTQGEKIYEQIVAMLADQFYHQLGDNITINRMELAKILTKQTLHGIELGAAAERESGKDGYVEFGKFLGYPLCFDFRLERPLDPRFVEIARNIFKSLTTTKDI